MWVSVWSDKVIKCSHGSRGCNLIGNSRLFCPLSGTDFCLFQAISIVALEGNKTQSPDTVNIPHAISQHQKLPSSAFHCSGRQEKSYLRNFVVQKKEFKITRKV